MSLKKVNHVSVGYLFLLVFILVGLGNWLLGFSYSGSGPSDTLSQQDIVSLRGKFERMNLDKRSVTGWEAYHENFGTYKGVPVEGVYVCYGDICPDNGGYILRYQGIPDNEECTKIGGSPRYGIGWSWVYAGCEVVP